jgi:hypothetical protein
MEDVVQGTVSPPNAVRSMDQLDLAAEDLKQLGYTAVHALNSPDELELLRKQFWDFFEALGTGIERNDVSTWTDDRWPLQGRGILHGYNVGWNKASWMLRTHPNVQKAFKSCWSGLLGTEVDGLLSSMDGLCLIRPPELVPAEKERIERGDFRSWPHTDQSPLKRGLDTIQGLVTLSDSVPDDGGLVVYAGTSKDYAEKYWLVTRARLAMALPGVNKDIVRNYERKKLCGPAGTLFLWDSRTVHCNEAPKIGRTLPSVPDGTPVDLAYLPRAVSYVCLSPASLATAQQRAKLASAGTERRSWGHNAYNLGLFPLWKPGSGPRGAGDPVDPANVDIAKGWISEDEVTDQMKRMLGILPYDDARSAPGTPQPRLSEEQERDELRRLRVEAGMENAVAGGSSSPSRL